MVYSHDVVSVWWCADDSGVFVLCCDLECAGALSVRYDVLRFADVCQTDLMERAGL